MLELDVVPGKSLGFFQIGMPISQALNLLTKNEDNIPVVEFIYNETSPLATELLLNCVDKGILLRIDPKTQQLIVIEIYDIYKTRISYGNSVFSGSSVASTFVKIYQVFGPTYPGEYDRKTNEYKLSYPGITFIFPIPHRYAHLYENSNEIPLEFPDGTTPLVKSVYIYKKNLSSIFNNTTNNNILTVVNNIGALFNNPRPVNRNLPQNPVYFEQVLVQLGSGLYFTDQQRVIGFGMSPQELLAELGPPVEIFYKEQDKVRIHLAVDSPQGQSGVDYFYNYYKHGIDFMFDGCTHALKKIILHTNIPGHIHFHQYAKCNFRILVNSGDILVNNVVKARENDKEKSSSSHEQETDYKFIEPDMKFDKIQELLGECGKPLIHDHTSTNNPFGGTKFYGYPDVIFEVMKNNHIASVTLFSGV